MFLIYFLIIVLMFLRIIFEKKILREARYPPAGDTSYLQIYTRVLPCLRLYYNIFYLNGVKIIPTNIETLLTPVGIAYWAIDDGSKAGSGFYFNTHSYTLEEQELLKSILFSKFGLLCNIHKHKNQYKLYIIASSITKFRTLVIPYFHDSIIYKLK